MDTIVVNHYFLDPGGAGECLGHPLKSIFCFASFANGDIVVIVLLLYARFCFGFAFLVRLDGSGNTCRLARVGIGSGLERGIFLLPLLGELIT